MLASCSPSAASLRANSGAGASSSSSSICSRGVAALQPRSRLACRQRRRQHSAIRSAAQTEDDLPAVLGLSPEYCNDFECTSSPAVEQTVRSVARDITRSSWSASRFARDCEYKDPMLSLKGRDSYDRNRFVRDCISEPKVRRCCRRCPVPPDHAA